jgi:CMP/dCMP kinase
MVLEGKINAVAIDGPAGSGKSTISKMVAAKLGFVYIDTGAMYRALTLKAMESNVDLVADPEKLIELSEALDIQITPSKEEGRTTKVVLDQVDVSEKIRTLEVTGNVKYVAKIGAVRNNLVELQRKMAEASNGSVMEGRDIGTVVLTDAGYKIFLDASFEERVERRYKELMDKGSSSTREDVEKDLSDRDHADISREVGPLKQAEDAVKVDTTGLTIEQVVDKIVDIVSGGNE